LARMRYIIVQAADARADAGRPAQLIRQRREVALIMSGQQHEQT
jgi:hypothetical protein